jgi:hypothetical protein
MNRKAYRATRVNDVNWEQIARGKEGLGLTLGVDVGKFDVLVVCRWADGRFERPWRIKNPWEIATFVALVRGRNPKIGSCGSTIRLFLR